MAEKQTQIKIDPDFKSLIRPLQRTEYLQLEQNIIQDGCRDPITIWNGYIIDGHNRYEICMRHHIPFQTRTMEFEYREQVIAWICANQLGRRNITEETRRFLIGIQYENEKIVGKLRNEAGINQHTKKDPSSTSGEGVDGKPISPEKFKHVTAIRIARENNVSSGTVQKYAAYSKAVEEISRKDPALASKILTGQYKISHNNIVALARLPKADLLRFSERIENTKQPYVQYSAARQGVNTTVEESTASMQPTVKDMPQFDPDAEINRLALTIPSWAGSIERTRSKTDLSITTLAAKCKLLAVLGDLEDSIAKLRAAIKED